MNGLNTKYSGKFTGPDRGFSLGFTLIEIIAALGIFILGFVSVMSLFMGAFKMQDEASTRMTESLVAESVYTSFREPEHPGLKAFLEGVSGADVFGINESEDYPGYFYYVAYEPFGVDTEENRIYIVIHVFEGKYKSLFEQFYTKDYVSLTAEEKELYDNKCLKFYTIIGDV